MVDTVVANGPAVVDRNTPLDMSGVDTLEVQVGASFNVTTGYTVRFNAATNGATISNDGGITNSFGGSAISFATGVGETINATITNQSTGLISSRDDAIGLEALSVTAGHVTIVNYGRINSFAGEGIDFANGAGTFVTDVQNLGGTITSVQTDAIRLGGLSNITNTGTINGAIHFEAGAISTVSNFNVSGGFIAGNGNGIRADAGSEITIFNGSGDGPTGGDILGRNGAGVASLGNVTVINYGTISGSFSGTSDPSGPAGVPDGIRDGDGDGIDVRGSLLLDNYDTIEGTGANGHDVSGALNVSQGVSAGGGAINNYAGATIRGANVGIQIDDGAGGAAPNRTDIYNDGVIEGGTGVAIRIVSATDDTITNNRNIIGAAGVAIEFGSGNNTLFVLEGSSITGLTDGGAGADTLNFLDYSSGATVNLQTGAASGTGGVTNFENVVGSSFDDGLTGDDNANTLSGNRGDDVLNGGGGADTLGGGSGNDTLDGGAGADRLLGGTGNDTYYVDETTDRVYDKVGQGVDQVYSSASFKIKDDTENLTLTGSANINATGNALGNVLVGNSGNNAINGGDGDDRITGGLGVDKLTGGLGADTFIFTQEADTPRGGSDKIYDFTSGEDQIDISAIDADGNAGNGVTAFTLDNLGDNSFQQGHIRQTVSNGRLLLEFNTDGDAAFEFSIILNDRTTAVTNGDFIL